MSEETPAILSESTTTVEPVSGLGGVLHAARETMGIGIEEAARKLCLSQRQLTALEADDIRALPSPAFTRGFIRNYARLLNLDADPLLAVYRDMLPQSEEGAAISLHSEGIQIQVGDRKTWMPYLLASILIGIFGGAWMAYMEWSERLAAPVAVVPAAQSAAPAAPAPLPVTEVAPPTIVETPAAAEMAPASTPVTTPAPEPAKGQMTMSFTQQSWVRIVDRDGVEVLSKTGSAGSEDVVNGQPPFKVEIGNAAGVQLSYNGQPVDLAPHTKANVARFVLE